MVPQYDQVGSSGVPAMPVTILMSVKFGKLKQVGKGLILVLVLLFPNTKK